MTKEIHAAHARLQDEGHEVFHRNAGLHPDGTHIIHPGFADSNFIQLLQACRLLVIAINDVVNGTAPNGNLTRGSMLMRWTTVHMKSDKAHSDRH